MKGSCLCGAVQYRIEPPFLGFQYCHCSRCRKQTGTVHGANIFVPTEQFEWLNGESQINHFKLPEAKYFASAFCSTCGSPLPWSTANGKNYVVPAGTLDDDPLERPSMNIFWESSAPWCIESQSLPKYAELPPRK